MVCYWLTSTTISLVQVWLLRIPAVRQFFKIPAIVNHKVNTHVQQTDVPKQGFMDAFRQSILVVCLKKFYFRILEYLIRYRGCTLYYRA